MTKPKRRKHPFVENKAGYIRVENTKVEREEAVERVNEIQKRARELMRERGGK